MLTGWFALVKEGSYVTSLPLHGTHGIYILFDKTHGIYILNTGEFRLSAGSKIGIHLYIENCPIKSLVDHLISQQSNYCPKICIVAEFGHVLRLFL